MQFGEFKYFGLVQQIHGLKRNFLLLMVTRSYAKPCRHSTPWCLVCTYVTSKIIYMIHMQYIVRKHHNKHCVKYDGEEKATIKNWISMLTSNLTGSNVTSLYSVTLRTLRTLKVLLDWATLTHKRERCIELMTCRFLRRYSRCVIYDTRYIQCKIDWQVTVCIIQTLKGYT